MRILLVDNHRLLSEGLKTLIEKEPGFRVVGTADNGRTALQMAQELSPDLVVMDVAMPELNGVEATRQLKKEFPRVKVLALSMHTEKQYVAGMLAAGASGYVLKDCAFEELAQAIRQVRDGGRYLSPGIVGLVLDDYVQRILPDQTSKLALLSSREREVLQLLAEGRSTNEIALRLHISKKTVETHRKNLMDRLDLYSVAELTKLAIREGLTSA